MFDTTMIGRRIKQARIDKNMTQMALADAMGVSYQAVSNWERGNSMPDISKLGDLCAALDLTVNELLGLEEAAPNAVKKAMDNEELTMEELTEVSPMLPPRMLREKLDEKQLEAARVKLEEKKAALKEKMARMKEEMAGKRVTYESDGVRVEESTEHGRRVVHVNVRRASEEEENRENMLDLSRIADMAPFLDQEYLESLVRSAELKDLYGLACVAPFLSQSCLDGIIDRYLESGSEEDITCIYPFLSRDAMRSLAARKMDERDIGDAQKEIPIE